MNPETDNDYRLFCWVNMYLSQIQRGIQTAHVVSQIAVNERDDKNSIYWHWASLDCTIQVYNGGMYSDISEISNQLQVNHGEYPYAKFYESSAAMNGMLTSVGVILPRKIWQSAKGKVDAQTIKDYRMIMGCSLGEAEYDAETGAMFRYLNENGFKDLYSDLDVYLIELIKKSRWA